TRIFGNIGPLQQRRRISLSCKWRKDYCISASSLQSIRTFQLLGAPNWTKIANDIHNLPERRRRNKHHAGSAKHYTRGAHVGALAHFISCKSPDPCCQNTPPHQSHHITLIDGAPWSLLACQK